MARIKKPKLRVVVPSGTEMLRVYHRNMIKNLRDLQDPGIDVPPIITRAKLVARQSREIVVREREGS